MIDTIIVLVVVFIIAIVVLNLNKLMSEANDSIQEDEDMVNESKVIMADLTGKYCPNWDGLIFSVLIVFWMAALVSAWMIDTNPVFFAITIVLLIFVLIVAAEVGNTYNDLTADDADNSCYHLSSFVLTHTLQFAIVIGFSIAIVLYAKLR